MERNGEVPLDIARYLLHHSHEYRALIRGRVSEARKAQRAKDNSIYRALWKRGYRWEDRSDIDLLGREVDGCG